MDGSPGMHSAGPRPIPRSRSVSTALLVELITEQLTAWQAERAADEGSAAGPAPTHIVDLGGGTGGLATQLIRPGSTQGYRVTVVDPSPDALAALDRRAVDAGLADRIRGLLGDTSEAVDLIGPAGADVAICHQVLEFVDDPAAALAAMATILRPGGLLSLVVTQRPAAVLSQAAAGHIAAARAVLADQHRFDRSMIINLVGQAGFEVTAVHGLGAASALVHESVLQTQTGALDDLVALERDISSQPDFQAIAPQLHVSARRPR